MAERARIARYFAPLAHGEPGSFALTDDAALLTPPQGMQLVVTTDSVIAGIHVLADADAGQVAQKLVRRNLSDLAAMGAVPWRYFLNLHTPRGTDERWFAEFSAMLAQEQQRFGMVLAGGDSTSGPGAVHATLTCLGLVKGAALLRSTALPGDDVYVSGSIGDAALGLAVLQQRLAVNSADAAALTQRYHAPEPRLALGAALQGVASAALDISDGLLADAAQLARTSGVQLRLQRAAIPLSQPAREALAADAAWWDSILRGGDDYELLFTAAPAQRDAVARPGMPVSRIGTVAEGAGVLLDGSAAEGGFEHA